MKYEQDASSVKSDNAESHFSSYAAPLVEQAVEHATALRENPDAEVLHKLRVALRRLRSLLWAYRPLLDRDLDDKQRALFKHLAGAAGRTRDWDILIELLRDVLEEDQLPIDRLRAARSAVAEESCETLTHAGIQSQLEDAVASSSTALDSAHQSTPRWSERLYGAAAASLGFGPTAPMRNTW
ncbi:CHAD domain-containing protein [Paraburkholderia xenovorans]|uniref:CHAD domain-containing protein n=1 Tax=Paraburkholderia xenovorans TaxID=36873 RepID=UPI0038B98654